MADVWAHLKADPIIRITGLLYTGLILVYGISLLSSWQLASLGDYLDFIFAALAVWALLYGVRQIKHPEERRFWLLIACGVAAFLVIEILYLPAPDAEAIQLQTREGLLALLYYAAVFLAVSANPHLKPGWSRGNRRYWTTSTASLLFVLGSVAYVFLIQITVVRGAESYVPNLLMYLCLDALVAGTFVYLSRTCGSIRWRNLYALLAVGWGLWAIASSVDLLAALSVWPLGYRAETILEFTVPYLPLIAVARLRHYAAPQQTPAEDHKRTSRQSPLRLGGSPILYLTVLPLFHFGGYWAEIFSPDAKPYREFIMLSVVLVLAALAFVNQKQLESERRILEEQARQSQKMEAVGTLAGGVAHDFNNMLTAIIGNAELLRSDDLNLTDRQRAEVEEIRKASERATSLTQQLLAFGRRQMLAPEVVDLNASVAEMQKLLRRLIGEDVELITELDSALGSVKADPAQIDQVIMNLAINARDAMPEGGEIRIGTANADVDEAEAQVQDGMVPGRYVMLVVSDTGSGMDAETREKIFEPFFTTKDTGAGTGLGLSTVYGIVKQSDGFIGVDSEPGHGTTFKIYLPRVDEPIEPPEPSTVISLQGMETVLLVEDEEMLRALARQVLQRNGYRVLEASGGPEAVEIFERHEGPINLLLTDVVMPKMSGHELAQRLTMLSPELKVLYISGYAEQELVGRGLSSNSWALLQKPFTPDALARRVRELLDSPGNGAEGLPSIV